MASKIQRKHLDKIWVKWPRNGKKPCEAKYGVVEEIQNQNGVVAFCNLKDATKTVLVKLDIKNIGYSLHT